MSKTLVSVISKISQLAFMDISEIPENMRVHDKFVLIASELLKEQITDEIAKLYKQIYYVRVKQIDDVRVHYVDADLDQALAEICKLDENVYVFTPDEVNLVAVEEVSAKYHIPTWHKGTGQVCRNKIFMKELMRKNNIRTPRFMDYSFEMSFEEIQAQIGNEVVIKPVDSYASMGVHIIKNKADYELFLTSHDSSFTYQVEEFISGTLYHIDTVKYNDKMFVSVGEYLHPVGDFIKGKACAAIEILPDAPHYQQLIAFNKLVVDSFANNGCFHHEAFINQQGEVIFLEIAWRQAGLPNNLIFTQHFGVRQTLMYMMLHIDPSADWVHGYNGEYQVKFFIPKKLGVYLGISLPQLYANYAVQNLIPLNSKVEIDPTSYADIAAILTLTYPSLKDNTKQIEADFNSLRQVI